MKCIKLAVVLCIISGTIHSMNAMENNEELETLQKEMDKLNIIQIDYQEKMPGITVFDDSNDDNNIESNITNITEPKKEKINRKKINSMSLNEVIKWGTDMKGLSFIFDKDIIKSFRPGDDIKFTVKTLDNTYTSKNETYNGHYKYILLNKTRTQIYNLSMTKKIFKRDGDIVISTTSNDVEKDIYDLTKKALGNFVNDIEYDLSRYGIEEKEKKEKNKIYEERLKFLVTSEKKRGRGPRDRAFKEEKNNTNNDEN